ncbi:MAG TPA: CotH kinase family protein, partial [Cellvibrionaceae bacterium]
PDQDSSGYNRLMLRNSGNDNDYTMFRDAMMQALGAELRMDTQAYRPTVVYINGEHWGILNLRERFDRHYLGRTYNLDSDNVDILTNNNEVDEGDAEHYLQTLDYIANNSMAADSHFEQVQTRIDTDNFIDYSIASIYVNNTDWPGNNIDYWRLRTSEYLPNAPYGHDGRWRWMWYDTDFGFGLYSNSGEDAAMNDTLSFATQAGLSEWPNPDWSTFLLRNLLENEDFKHDFINRFADLLNTHFHAERVTGVIEQMKAEIAADMHGHHARWKHPWVQPNSLNNWWQQQVQIMTDFANARPAYQRQHLRDYFGLGGDYQLTLNNSDTSRGHIRVNSVEILPSKPGVEGYPWSGTYFAGVPIELEAIAAPGFTFSHWSGLPDNTGAKAELTPNGDLEVTAHFVASAPPYLHAFVFDNEMANNTPLETIEATLSYTENSGRIVFHSALAGYPFTSESPNWRRASMERRNAPTPINYPLDTPYGDFNMRAVQIKQPFMGDAGENTLILELPTTGHSATMLRFAAMDEGAADSLLIDYATNSGNPLWTTAGLSQTILPLSDEFQGYTINFAGIAAVDNNPHFKVRIRFAGPDMMADNGDRVTFNNITLDLHQSEELAYFWLFDNNLTNDTELTHIAPHFAALPGAHISYHSALPGYPDTDRKASMERRNEPTDVNYFAAGNYGTAFSDVNMRAVQIRQPFQGPSGENAILLHLPTSGMHDPLLRFAAMDEGAAQFLRLDYATNSGQPQWTRAGLAAHTLPLIEDSYQLYTVDFSGINSARNNPHFKVRIRFGGDDMTVDNGDRVSFNNISLHSRLAGAETDLPDVPIDADNPNAPTNNRFVYAQTLSGASGSSLGSNVHASTETNEPDHASAISGASAGNSVWWRWTAPDTERMLFSSQLSAIDSLVAVYTGTGLQNLTPVDAVNLAADQLWLVAEAGETYHIAVAGNVSGNHSAEGDIALTWESAAPAAAPVIINSLPGEAGIICEVPECALDEQGNVAVISDNRQLSVILPNPDTHQHRLKATEGEQTLWDTVLKSELPGTLSRVMADVNGLPFVASRFSDADGKLYQIDAFADGRARQRIVTADGEVLLNIHSLIPGAEISVNQQSLGQVLVTFPTLGEDGMRLLLEIDADTYLQARYQRYNSSSESWANNSDLLTDTRFAPGATVLLERIDGEISIRIDSHIADDLYF